MMDSQQWFRDKLEQFKDDFDYLEEKRIIEEGERMDRDTIIEIFDRYMEGSLPSDQFADEILALFEGWKSPEEVRQMLDTDDYLRGYTDGYYKTKGCP
jgi:hypothetical protein